MGLREVKREQLIQQIVEAVAESIRDVGYEETRVEDVARQLTISKPTFYRYFESKDDVLTEIQIRMTEDWAVELESRLEADVPFVETLRALGQVVARDLLADEPLFRVVHLHSAPQSGDRLRAAERRAERALVRVIAAGQARGDVATGYAPDLLGLIVESILFTVSYAWATRDISSHDLQDALVGALLASYYGFASSD